MKVLSIEREGDMVEITVASPEEAKRLCSALNKVEYWMWEEDDTLLQCPNCSMSNEELVAYVERI